MALPFVGQSVPIYITRTVGIKHHFIALLCEYSHYKRTIDLYR